MTVTIYVPNPFRILLELGKEIHRNNSVTRYNEINENYFIICFCIPLSLIRASGTS